MLSRVEDHIIPVEDRGFVDCGKGSLGGSFRWAWCDGQNPQLLLRLRHVWNCALLTCRLPADARS